MLLSPLEEVKESIKAKVTRLVILEEVETAVRRGTRSFLKERVVDANSTHIRMRKDFNIARA